MARTLRRGRVTLRANCDQFVPARGEVLDTFIAGLGRIPLGAGGVACFSAHELGSWPRRPRSRHDRLRHAWGGPRRDRPLDRDGSPCRHPRALIRY